MRSLEEIQYEINADSRRFFPDRAEDLGHHILGLAGEVGELANMVKKWERGSIDLENEDTYAELVNEVVDVFIYVMSTAAIIGMDMETFYEAKREYNYRRFVEDMG